MTFSEVIKAERGREIVEQLEERISEEEIELVRIRKTLCKELKDTFEYEYVL